MSEMSITDPIMGPIVEARKILDSMEELVARTDVSWKVKYQRIFSPEGASRIRVLGLHPDYVDPDSDYRDDVSTYLNALRAHLYN